MRLISVLTVYGETLGVVDEERWLPAERLVPDGPATMGALIDAGVWAIEALEAAARAASIGHVGSPVRDAHLLAPLPRPRKIVAIGRNYRDHTTEEGVEPPPAPLVFAKWPSSVIGPDDDVSWDPDLTRQVDYEAELAVVIGRTARNVNVTEALDHVFGYTCLNDVSARDIQFGDGQWIRGKSLDTFCPMGPAIVTGDEIADPQDLAISCSVGGERLQDARTSSMFFSVAEIISYCSRSFSLEPGDVIATGTPGGVGVFRDPPRFLRDGDRMTVDIERIGRLENTCRFAPVEAVT